MMGSVAGPAWGGGTRMKIVQARLTGLPSAVDSGVTFFCTPDYDHQACLRDLHVLAEALAGYDVTRLGGWQFVVARSNHWKETIRELGGDPGSPAFTVMDARVTVFEEALFHGTALERADLLERYRIPLDRLLDYAVTHELAHALCGEHNEGKAERMGSELRAVGTTRCDVETIESSNRAKRPGKP